MEFLLKASAVVTIFYFCYKLFLQRDTFFESNRMFLLIGLFTAFCLPFIVIPIYIEQAPLILDNYVFNDMIVTKNTEQAFTLLQLLSVIYALGVSFFFIRFAIQLLSIVKVLFNNDSEKDDRYIYIKTTNNVPPFSFFNWIVYNPNLFNKNELKQIITHEKIHVRQHHSIDILLTQLSCIVLWFNPFIWLYNKDIKQNLEFIADQNAQQKSGCKKSYQYTLLKTSMPKHQLALTNNFYNSLIKKRIVMLHKSKSKKTNQLKYFLIIPILALFLMSFNTKEIYITKEVPVTKNLNNDNTSVEDIIIENYVISEKHTPKTSFTNNQVKKTVLTNLNSNTKTIENKGDTQMVLITKDFKDADFDKIKNKLKKEGITIKFKGIKRNNSGEITSIKIDVNSKQSNSNYNISSDKAIKPIKISFDKEGGNISIGNGHSIHAASNSNRFHFKSKNGKHKIHSTGSGGNVYVISSDENIHGDTIYLTRHENKIIHSKNVKIIIDGDNNADSLYIIDEEKVEKDVLENLNQDEIKSILVLKNDNATKKYGKKGKNGVVKIINKKIGKNSNTFFISSNDDTEPLYIIDGKEVKKDVLDIDNIKSVIVLKGDAAIKKYGNKAKNGVIEITTKKKQ